MEFIDIAAIVMNSVSE